MRTLSERELFKIGWRGALVGAVAVALSGCISSESSSSDDDDTADSGDSTPVTVNSPADIAQVSAASYDDNENGLITAATLQSWIDDWEGNRPDGIEGDLVILQVNAHCAGDGCGDDSSAEETWTYITPKESEGVYTYVINPGARLMEDRSNGVIVSRSMVASGPTMDQFLEDFNLDPTNDMLVWAMGDAGAGTLMRTGRGWYAMRYWGTPAENLAKLNGGAYQVMDDAYLSSQVSCDELQDAGCHPGGGTVSVRDLPEDNFSMLASVQDVISVVEGNTDAFIWDARSHTEYTAVDDPDDGVDFRNSATKQGHPKGAVVLPYANLTKDDGSWRYKDKATLEALLAGDEVDGGRFQVLVEGVSSSDVEDYLQPAVDVGEEYQPGQTSITYCETTMRAMVTGFASAGILGLPNRFYDGATVEWNSLSNIQDKEGNIILPSDSPWRTDNQLSHYVLNDPANIDPRDIVDAYAESANLISVTDRAYQEGDDAPDPGDPGNGDDGNGSAPPPAPCG